MNNGFLHIQFLSVAPTSSMGFVIHGWDLTPMVALMFNMFFMPSVTSVIDLAGFSNRQKPVRKSRRSPERQAPAEWWDLVFWQVSPRSNLLRNSGS